MSVVARRMTPEEHAQGYMICDCGTFAYVFRASVLAELPQGYHGERCPECNLWLVAADKLRPDTTPTR